MTIKELKEVPNIKLVEIMENAVYSVCQRDSVANTKWLEKVQKEILDRLEGKG